MSQSAHLQGMELLRDVMSESCVPARKPAGWKRDQYLRRPAPIRLEFAGELSTGAAFTPASSATFVPSVFVR